MASEYMSFISIIFINPLYIACVLKRTFNFVLSESFMTKKGHLSAVFVNFAKLKLSLYSTSFDSHLSLCSLKEVAKKEGKQKLKYVSRYVDCRM